MDADNVRKLVARECAKAGSMRKWAELVGVSVAYVSDVLAGNRPPGPSMLDHLGLVKVTVTTYRKAR